MQTQKRIFYVDVFRGFALLYMVLCHLFNYFSIKSIYESKPYYIEIFDIPTLLPPPYLFLVVSGMSVYLLLKNRKERGFQGFKLWLEVVKRYGSYVLISLPFTSIVFGFDIYYQWEEAIQGIGLAAIFVALILLSLKFDAKLFIALAVLIFSSKDLLFQNLANLAERNPDFSSFEKFFLGLIANLTFRGWFSLVSSVPMLLTGVILINWFLKNESRKVLAFGISSLLIALTLHFSGFKIDYYFRTPATIFFIFAESSLASYLLYYLSERKNLKEELLPLRIYGIFSLWVYLGHFLFIVKGLELLGYIDSFPEPDSWFLAILATTLIYVIVERYYFNLKKLKGSKVHIFLLISIAIVSFIFLLGFAANSLAGSYKKILIVVAHPDDESIGIGGLIVKNALIGNEVRIVMVTDGNPDEFKLGEEYEKQRIKELDLALKKVGLSLSNVYFLGYDDLNFIVDLKADGLKKAIEKLKKIIDSYKPDEIYTHAYEHGHIDHDTVNFIVRKAYESSIVKGKAKLYEFSEYNPFYYGKPIPPEKDAYSSYKWKKLKLSKFELKLKKELISSFVSQDQKGACNLSLDFPKPREICKKALIDFFFHGEDTYREMPSYDYTRSPCINDSCRYNKVVGGVNWSIFYEIINDYEEKYEKQNH